MNASGFLTQASIFRPTLYSGCATWLDGSDLSMFGLNGSNGAELWRDKSPSTLNVTQGTAANCPNLGNNTLNGRPVLTFDGVNDRLFNTTNFPTDAPLGIAIFAVVKYTSTGDFRMIVDNNHGSGFGFQNTSGNRLTAFSNASLPITVQSTFDVGDNTWRILSFVSISNVGTYLRINKVTDVSISHPSSALGVMSPVLSVGAWHSNGTPSRFYPGQLAELIIYRAPFHPAQVQKVENYLSGKWGLP